jgi:hypothetical protein
MELEIDIDDVLHLSSLEARLPELREAYGSATPFPHIVLDGVLTDDTLAKVYRELDPVDFEGWTNYLHVNERKYSNTTPSTWGPTTQIVHDAFSTQRFLTFLSSLTGIERLKSDPILDGGGLHRSMRGGFLNVHADFTAHHKQQTWRRRVNLLLYLNPDWQPEWGGELELWDRDVTRCEARVAPLGNRVLLFTTDEDSYHGHPDPLNFPEGVPRQSMALYYFTEEEAPLTKSTNYRARPTDSATRGMAIYLDKKLLSFYDVFKRRFKWSDQVVSKVLGKLSRKRR